MYCAVPFVLLFCSLRPAPHHERINCTRNFVITFVTCVTINANLWQMLDLSWCSSVLDYAIYVCIQDYKRSIDMLVQFLIASSPQVYHCIKG